MSIRDYNKSCSMIITDLSTGQFKKIDNVEMFSNSLKNAIIESITNDNLEHNLGYKVDFIYKA